MIDIYKFGKHKEGLTYSEVSEYLRLRNIEQGTKFTDLKKMEEIYNKIAGVNTCMLKMVDGVETVMNYRHDVERFADKLFLGSPTYFD